MEFEYDGGKSDRNQQERGFDFAFATLVFEGRTVERVDARRSYGETRIKATGQIDGMIYTVVYTDRGDVRRIISARIANRKERMEWQSSE